MTTKNDNLNATDPKRSTAPEAPKEPKRLLNPDLQAAAQIDRIMSKLSEADRSIVYDRFVRVYKPPVPKE